MANIATIAISIRANTKKFNKSLKKMTKDLKKFFSSIKSGAKTMAKFGLAVSAVGVAGFTALIVNSAAAIDRMGKLGRALGIATKDIATFRLVADLGGGTLEQFAKASKQVAKNVFDFIVRGTGEATDAFKELNITTQDLIPIQNNHVALMELIGSRLKLMEDGAVKTAVQVKLLGARASELGPALEDLADGGLARFAKLTEQAGTAMSENLVKRVEDMNDSFRITREFIAGFIDQLTAQLAPSLKFINEEFQDWLVSLIESKGGVLGLAESVAGTLINAFADASRAVANFINPVIRFINKLLLVVASVRQAFSDLQTKFTNGLLFFRKGTSAIFSKGEVIEQPKLLSEINTRGIQNFALLTEQAFQSAKRLHVEQAKIEKINKIANDRKDREAAAFASRPGQQALVAAKGRIAEAQNRRKEFIGTQTLAKFEQILGAQAKPKNQKEFEQLKELELIRDNMKAQLEELQKLNRENLQARAG